MGRHPDNRAGWTCSLCLGLLGALFLLTPIGNGLRLCSFDWPFRVATPHPPDSVLIVEIDEESHRKLQQPFEGAWDRALHIRLLDALTPHHPRAIVFDILFDTCGTNAATDQDFAERIRSNGNVFLAAQQVRSTLEDGSVVTRVHRAVAPIGLAAAASGIANLPLDRDGVIRRHPVYLPHSSLAGVAAAGTSNEVRDLSSHRWIRFYGPPGIIPRISYATVLSRDGATPEDIEDKIVFVGMGPTVGPHGEDRSDRHSTPFTQWTGFMCTGVELHATLAANLRCRDWIEELNGTVQLAAIVCAALGLGLGLYCLRPGSFTLLSVSVAGGAALIGILGQNVGRWFWPWLVVSVVQVPAALVWYWVVQSMRFMPAATRYDVFISYRRRCDGNLAKRVADALRKHRLRTFIDIDSLSVGRWHPGVVRAINSSSNVIVVVSNRAFVNRGSEPDMLRDELERARSAGCNVIPLHVGPVEDLGLPDWATWLTEHQGVQISDGFSQEQFDGTIMTLASYCERGRKAKAQKHAIV